MLFGGETEASCKIVQSKRFPHLGRTLDKFFQTGTHDQHDHPVAALSLILFVKRIFIPLSCASPICRRSLRPPLVFFRCKTVSMAASIRN